MSVWVAGLSDGCTGQFGYPMSGMMAQMVMKQPNAPVHAGEPTSALTPVLDTDSSVNMCAILQSSGADRYFVCCRHDLRPLLKREWRSIWG